MIIKVCGMKYPENIRAVAGLNVDWLGFIFYEKSPRYCIDSSWLDSDIKSSTKPPHRSKLRYPPPLLRRGAFDTYIVSDLLKAIKPITQKKAGVFVNATTETITQAINLLGLDFIQLHGDESPQQCALWKEQGVQVIKAFPIATAKDIDETGKYEGVADYFLFDTKTSGYGGSGKAFDWTLLDLYKGNTPFLLSGGISPESIEDILRIDHPAFAGIDLNSRFEIEPGIKDTDALHTFIQQVKQ